MTNLAGAIGFDAPSPHLDKAKHSVAIGVLLAGIACSTRDLLEIIERLKQAEAGRRSLHEPWAGTTSPAGRMVLTIFAGMAEFLLHAGRSARVPRCLCLVYLHGALQANASASGRLNSISTKAIGAVALFMTSCSIPAGRL